MSVPKRNIPGGPFFSRKQSNIVPVVTFVISNNLFLPLYSRPQRLEVLFEAFKGIQLEFLVECLYLFSCFAVYWIVVIQVQLKESCFGF